MAGACDLYRHSRRRLSTKCSVGYSRSLYRQYREGSFGHVASDVRLSRLAAAAARRAHLHHLPRLLPGALRGLAVRRDRAWHGDPRVDRRRAQDRPRCTRRPWSSSAPTACSRSTARTRARSAAPATRSSSTSGAKEDDRIKPKLVSNTIIRAHRADARDDPRQDPLRLDDRARPVAVHPRDRARGLRGARGQRGGEGGQRAAGRRDCRSAPSAGSTWRAPSRRSTPRPRRRSRRIKAITGKEPAPFKDK